MSDLEQKQQELAAAEERQAKLKAADAKLSIPDLESFEAASDEARVALYRVAPDHAMRLYDELWHKNRDQFADRKRKQGTYAAE